MRAQAEDLDGGRTPLPVAVEQDLASPASRSTVTGSRSRSRTRASSAMSNCMVPAP
jgi:hypothetical protein